MELLARRPHFRAELERKLADRGFPAAAVEAALGRLTERGYLDDRTVARRFAEEAVGRKGYGPRRLRSELAARGVEGEDVADAVSAAYPEGELERALVVAARARRPDPAALARHLDRKGFSKPVILEIIHRFGRDSDGSPFDP